MASYDGKASERPRRCHGTKWGLGADRDGHLEPGLPGDAKLPVGYGHGGDRRLKKPARIADDQGRSGSIKAARSPQRSLISGPTARVPRSTSAGWASQEKCVCRKRQRLRHCRSDQWRSMAHSAWNAWDNTGSWTSTMPGRRSKLGAGRTTKRGHVAQSVTDRQFRRYLYAGQPPRLFSRRERSLTVVQIPGVKPTARQVVSRMDKISGPDPNTPTPIGPPNIRGSLNASTPKPAWIAALSVASSSLSTQLALS